MKDGQQTCSVGRLDKFKELNVCEVQEDGYNRITRFCNFLRNEQWDHSCEFDDKQYEQLRQEARPKVTWIINATGQCGVTDLVSTLESVKDEGLIVVVINEDVDAETFDRLIKFVREILGHSNFYMVKPAEGKFWAEDGFMRAKNSYCCFIEAGYEVDTSIVDDLDVALNDDLSMVIGVKPTDEIPVMAIQATAYKFVKGNLGATAIEKLEEIAKESNYSGPPTIFTWENLK